MKAMSLRRCAIPLLVLALAGIAPASRAEAAWMWSPNTGWVGPSGAVKDTPHEQLAYAQSLFDQHDDKRAKVEFQKLLKHYKDSTEAPLAQYFLGRCEEAEGDGYAAFLAYRKTIQVYPSTAQFEEVLGRMYDLGNQFLGGKKRRVLGAALVPARDKAAEIFQAIVEDGPFTQYGELGQYKLGITYLSLGEYEQAVSAFEQLIDRYPKSPLVDDARFQLAQASLRGTFRPGYDQHPTDQALGELETFVQEYPSSELSPEALERLKVLQEQRAEHEFGVAQFYERQHQSASARLYYQGIVEQYPQTSWAPKAAAQLQALPQ